MLGQLQMIAKLHCLANQRGTRNALINSGPPQSIFAANRDRTALLHLALSEFSNLAAFGMKSISLQYQAHGFDNESSDSTCSQALVAGMLLGSRSHGGKRSGRRTSAAVLACACLLLITLACFASTGRGLPPT